MLCCEPDGRLGNIRRVECSVYPDDDGSTELDRDIRQAGPVSGSDGIQGATQFLRDCRVEEAYAEAWEEWVASGDATAWESLTGDGIAQPAP